MSYQKFFRASCGTGLAAAVVFGLTALAVWADDPQSSVSSPGFRPYSAHAPVFLDALPTATVAVYPSIVRRLERTAHSFASREQIVASLRESHLATAVLGNTRIDLGKLHHQAQWDVFENDMYAIGQELGRQSTAADYHLIMEFVVLPGNQAIFGVHCFILDQQGRNAFSFLLNSHHQAFIDANLVAENSSEEARTRMMARATQLGMAALQAQIEHGKLACATHSEVVPVASRAGRVDGFEGGLPEGTDAFGNPLGFVVFSDDGSVVNISTTNDYPALPPKTGRNSVLRLDMNVTGWAAVVHLFEDREIERWIARDWSAVGEFSFWLYGSNTGTALFVDILDNRKLCSIVDDAERYVYEFADDFLGWERVTVRFADLRRKEVGNGAPNDGLNLSAVHGYAIGALNTGGPVTFYIDDVDLRRTPTGHRGYAINELPMFGGREKTAAQQRADETYIKSATRGGRSRAVAAEAAARTGWNSYYRNADSTAIKRFNQAWLLDPQNQLALWGFAVICADRGEFEDAVMYFEMAIDNGGEHPSLRRDYDFALKQLQQATP